MCSLKYMYVKKKKKKKKKVRQGGVLWPQLFAIYMNDLAVCLTQCKAGCRQNETVTNHVC